MQAKPDSINIQEIVDVERVLADIEIVNTVKTTFIDSTDTILDMNVLSNYYKSMLKEGDVKTLNYTSNYFCRKTSLMYRSFDHQLVMPPSESVQNYCKIYLYKNLLKIHGIVIKTNC